MFKKFPPENPCGPMLEEIIQPKRINKEVAKNRSMRPPRVNQIIQALNLRARYELGGREGRAGKAF